MLHRATVDDADLSQRYGKDIHPARSWPSSHICLCTNAFVKYV